MLVHSFLVVLLVFIASTVNADDSNLTPFAKKARSELPKAAFNKLFDFKPKNDKEFIKAVNEGTRGFGETLGQPASPGEAKQFEDQGKRLAGKLTPPKLFTIFGNAIGQTLKDQGILNSSNMDSLAKKYADQLKKASDSVSGDDVPKIGYAIGAANAKFLQSLNKNTSELAKSFFKNLIAENKKL